MIIRTSSIERYTYTYIVHIEKYNLAISLYRRKGETKKIMRVMCIYPH